MNEPGPCLRVVATLPTGLTHPKALAVGADGRLYAGCAASDGGIVCWRPADDDFVVDWQVSCGRVRGLACRADGLIMATVRRGDASRIAGFAAGGREALTWGIPGDAAGKLCNPQGLACAADGRLWTAEATAWDGRIAHTVNRLQAFHTDGTPAVCVGTTGSAPGAFNLPIGVACAADGRIWVADTYNHRLQAFTGDGTPSACWGGLGRDPGSLNCPQGVWPLPDGDLLVADTLNDRVQRFGQDGALRWCHGPGRGTAEDRLWLPCAVAADRRGRLIVADTMNHRLQICVERQSA